MGTQMDRFSASDDKTKILFFDCECANCKGGVGKICSLGYVLCDDKFNVIQKEDIVMNTESEFDWYLFSGKGDISLSYSREYFRSQGAFPEFYEKIKALFTENNPMVAGFAVGNDVGFVNSACSRYKLPFIEFQAFDVEKILSQFYGEKRKLKDWFSFFAYDDEGLQFHNSADDAHATMLCLKYFCRDNKKEVFEIFESHKDLFVSSQQMVEQARERDKKKRLKEKIERFHNRSNKNPTYTTVLNQNFELDSSMCRTPSDLERSLKLVHKIYENGGILRRHLRAGTENEKGGYVIFANETSEQAKSVVDKRFLFAITEKELLSILE
ncbi:MAG: exonuclease domain-containing protein [Treponemataceae bacterium]|nr:exonuclease domain-containing protein [Spirochaetales bacterium]MDY6030198.1 exonuclease domain-containing protein [Treponemataceae bacterium]